MPDTKPVNTEKLPVGRPSGVDGKRVNVYLDADSIAIATEIGNGNVSEGIRFALKKAKNCCK